MRALLLALLTVALLSLPPATSSSRYCGSHGEPALGVITVGSGEAGSTTLYVDDRNLVLGNGVWLYMESNWIDGLQRGGHPLTGGLLPDETEDFCVDDPSVPPDTLLL